MAVKLEVPFEELDSIATFGRVINSNFVRKISWRDRKALLVAGTHFGEAAAFRKSNTRARILRRGLQSEEDLVRDKSNSLVLLGDFLRTRWQNADRSQGINA